MLLVFVRDERLQVFMARQFGIEKESQGEKDGAVLAVEQCLPRFSGPVSGFDLI